MFQNLSDSQRGMSIAVDAARAKWFPADHQVACSLKICEVRQHVLIH